MHIRPWITNFQHPAALKSESASQSVVWDSLRSSGPQTARFLCQWNFPGKDTGMSSRSLLQGIFLTQDRIRSPVLQADSLPAESPEKTSSPILCDSSSRLCPPYLSTVVTFDITVSLCMFLHFINVESYSMHFSFCLHSLPYATLKIIPILACTWSLFISTAHYVKSIPSNVSDWRWSLICLQR